MRSARAGLSPGSSSSSSSSSASTSSSSSSFSSSSSPLSSSSSSESSSASESETRVSDSENKFAAMKCGRKVSAPSRTTRAKKGVTMKRKESELGVRAGAKSELESKLLALKEQREVLRGKGARHDDEIMKENAFLQKELKSEIARVEEQLLDIKGQLESLKSQPAISGKKRLKPKEENAVSDETRSSHAGGSTQGEDASLVLLLSRLSDMYARIRATNGDLAQTLQEAEAENKALKRQVVRLKKMRTRKKRRKKEVKEETRKMKQRQKKKMMMAKARLLLAEKADVRDELVHRPSSSGVVGIDTEPPISRPSDEKEATPPEDRYPSASMKCKKRRKTESPCHESCSSGDLDPSTRQGSGGNRAESCSRSADGFSRPEDEQRSGAKRSSPEPEDSLKKEVGPTVTSAAAGRKALPIIGKMPCLNKKKKAASRKVTVQVLASSDVSIQSQVSLPGEGKEVAAKVRKIVMPQRMDLKSIVAATRAHSMKQRQQQQRQKVVVSGEAEPPQQLPPLPLNAPPPPPAPPAVAPCEPNVARVRPYSKSEVSVLEIPLPPEVKSKNLT